MSELERHLCHHTDTLFNLQNRIILSDLTNFYFEGSKRESRKAKFGRSKEKRNDCKLLLLALSINTAVRYWVVNTIRHQLKQSGINCYWTEIVRRMSTQKLVTTQGVNPLGDQVELRQCSQPKKSAQEIFNALGYREAPFKKIKICRIHQPPDTPATNSIATKTKFIE